MKLSDTFLKCQGFGAAHRALNKLEAPVKGAFVHGRASAEVKNRAQIQMRETTQDRSPTSNSFNGRVGVAVFL